MDPGSIILDLELDSDKITISLTDFGHAFEPDNAPIPDVDAPIEERELGGFGLFFIQQSVDEMKYHTSEDGNTMTLIKHLAQPSGG
jgi:anti-sigma regulatory factor (Ser/Thr protein kinase)